MLKQFVRGLTPPFIFTILQNIRRRFLPGASIYNGLYSDASQLPKIDGSPFAHANWITYVAERAMSRKSGVSNQDMHEICLSLLVSSLPCSSVDDELVVVDFGGGVGMYWPALKAQNKAHRKVRYVVVDGKENCTRGKKIFDTDPVDFHSDFASAVGNYPQPAAINVASTLQYCLDYESVIAMLCGSQPGFIVVSRHPAPDDGLPIAYTIQNVISPKGVCGQIPVVLISVAILTELMRMHGYVLVADYCSDLDPGKYWKYGSANIRQDFLRIVDHALIFQRQTSMPSISVNADNTSPMRRSTS